MPNATRGRTGSGWQPPGSEHTPTRLTPRRTSKAPVARMVRANGITKGLASGMYVARDISNRPRRDIPSLVLTDLADDSNPPVRATIGLTNLRLTR